MKTEKEIRDALELCRNAGVLSGASEIIGTLKFVLDEDSLVAREIRDLAKIRAVEIQEESALRYCV